MKSCWDRIFPEQDSAGFRNPDKFFEIQCRDEKRLSKQIKLILIILIYFNISLVQDSKSVTCKLKNNSVIIS